MATSAHASSPLRAELTALITAGAKDLLEHPYYRGLLDGTLPAESLSHLCRQDAHHLLPTYARALSRCAATAQRNEHARLLCRMAHISFDSSAGSAAGFPAMAEKFGLPDGAAGAPAIAGATLGYVHFLTAATTGPLAAGLGATLPSAWLYQLVTDELIQLRKPETRYHELIEIMYPGKEYVALIEEFLTLIDEHEADSGSAEVLLEQLGRAIAYEYDFVEAAWRAAA
ncbi:hypothetical protein GCM10022222_79660 [Amycolatopsis ultiminotia]|uniref:Thiaminase-2/PQQC domain-containing protein n=1 Tax=Amycolatopsis ultiminotia TaxID=543629 RepID=A0ABP6YG20_9PSEU